MAPIWASLAFLSILGQTSPRPDPTTILATVGSKAIHASDVEPLLWEWHKEAVLRELAAIRMVELDAAAKRITVTEEQVAEAVRIQLQNVSRQAPDGQSAADFLQERGFTMSRLALRAKTDLLLDRIAEQELKPEDYVQVSTIGVRPAGEKATEVAAAIQKLMTAYERLKKGDAWTQVLRDTTEDTAFTQNDGFLGWVALEAFPESTRKEIATLKIGGITQPVQTQNGIQLFRVDKKGADATPAVRADLLLRLKPTLKTKALERIRKTYPLLRPESVDRV